MKKLLILLLAVLMVFIFVACDDDEDDNDVEYTLKFYVEDSTNTLALTKVYFDDDADNDADDWYDVSSDADGIYITVLGLDSDDIAVAELERIVQYTYAIDGSSNQFEIDRMYGDSGRASEFTGVAAIRAAIIAGDPVYATMKAKI